MEFHLRCTTKEVARLPTVLLARHLSCINLEVFLMSEVHEEALISRVGQPTSTNAPAAQRSGRTATKLDNLLVLAAVLAYTFGWGPILGNQDVGFYTTGLIILVAMSLLWLLFERVVPLKGRWVASDGWLRTLTKGDVLILLLALLNSTLLHIPSSWRS
jgi:hypothetical protein